jgi:hypothetical protein
MGDMTAIERAKRLLVAAGHEPDGCAPRCNACANAILAEGTIGLKDRDTLRVLIGAAKALRWEHQKRLDTFENKASAEEFRDGELADGCQVCKALAEFEKLFAEEE